MYSLIVWPWSLIKSPLESMSTTWLPLGRTGPNPIMRLSLTATSPILLLPVCKAIAKPLSSPQCFAYLRNTLSLLPLASNITFSFSKSLYTEPAYLKIDSAITRCQFNSILRAMLRSLLRSTSVNFLPSALVITFLP